MDWPTLNAMISEMNRTMRQADNVVKETAELCTDRLRRAGVNGTVLAALKRELRDYNIHTNSWRESK